MSAASKDAAARREAAQKQDAAALAEVGVTPRLGDYPRTIAQLARIVNELRRRVATLERNKGAKS